MSETATSRHIFAPYCKGFGIDMGFGHDLTVPEAFGFDMSQSYTSVGMDKQTFQGDMRNLPFLCNESVDYLVSSHLLEDASYKELAEVIIPEWRRVLKQDGLLLTNCPDQQKFLKHCAATGQGLNLAHVEEFFSLQGFKENVLFKTGSWEVIFEEPNHGPYSWLLIVRKI